MIYAQQNGLILGLNEKDNNQEYPLLEAINNNNIKTGHSLDQSYWQDCLDGCCGRRPRPRHCSSSLNHSPLPPSHPYSHSHPPVWNINGPITVDEIENAVRSF